MLKPSTIILGALAIGIVAAQAQNRPNRPTLPAPARPVEGDTQGPPTDIPAPVRTPTPPPLRTDLNVLKANGQPKSLRIFDGPKNVDLVVDWSGDEVTVTGKMPASAAAKAYLKAMGESIKSQGCGGP